MVSLLALSMLTCQRTAPAIPTQPSFEQALGVTPLPSATPSQTPEPSPTITPTLTPSPTQTLTPTITPIPTATPIATITPVPGDRLQAAHQAFAWGDFPGAGDAFAAIQADPGATAADQQAAAYWLGRSQIAGGDYQAAIQSLQNFIQAYPDDPRLAWAHFMIADSHQALGEHQPAIDAYYRYLELDDSLAVYAYQAIAQAAMLALDYDQAVQAYTAGLQAAPDNSWAVQMREGIAQAELARSDSDAAVKQYDAILGVAEIGSYRAKILYLAGQALLKKGDEEAAYQRFDQAIKLYPTAQYAYLSLVELVVNSDQPVDDYRRGRVDYFAEAYQPAIEAFERALAENPELADGDGIWYLALALKGNGNLWQSIEQFQKLIQDFPQNQHVEQAWLEIGQAYEWREEIDQALVNYRTFAQDYPQSGLAARALWEAAYLKLDRGDLIAAAASFRDMATRYPDDSGAPDALFKAALLDYRRQDFQSARDGWQNLVETYPEHELRSSAHFWTGKAWLAQDDAEQADAAFKSANQWSPDSYYGLRAAELMGQDGVPVAAISPQPPLDPGASQAEAETWLASWLPVEPGSDLSALPPEIAQDPGWQRADALLAVGRKADALEEFETFKEDWWDDPLAMYQMSLAFRDREVYRLSIVSAERLTWTSPIESREEVPTFIQTLSYPLYYGDLITESALEEGIDPLALFTLIRQESLFETVSTSRADARGLAQVIPPTGEWIAGRLGWADWEEDDLYLPYVSVPFGAFYLAVQLATFDNEIVPALAAYNAGPGRVHEWLDESADLDLFVETMTFSEPRRYVRSIYGDYDNYRQLYQPPSGP